MRRSKRLHSMPDLTPASPRPLPSERALWHKVLYYTLSFQIHETEKFKTYKKPMLQFPFSTVGKGLGNGVWGQSMVNGGSTVIECRRSRCIEITLIATSCRASKHTRPVCSPLKGDFDLIMVPPFSVFDSNLKDHIRRQTSPRLRRAAFPG